jgi:SAM-dependent methyltransferase
MTIDWSAGYVAEISYTYGFYRELTPSLLGFATLVSGHRAPNPLTYCELGCGQGYSSNLLAAANPHIQFHATDFNPAQVAGARDLATESGSDNLTFYEDSFAEFAVRDDLPEFDIIALHGIYSWISSENRAVIVDFIRRRLRAGGLVYISYNSLPGWSAAMPLRRLLVDSQGGNQPILERIDQALTFAEKMAGANGRFFAQNSGMKERLEKIRTLPRAYVAHEYFNRDWTPFYHADVAADMGQAKLNWITSAYLLDRLDAINLTQDQQKLLAQVTDVTRQETLRDYMVNQQFRRDIFVKGAVRPPSGRLTRDWMEQRFVLSVTRENASLKVSGALGEAVLQEDIYNPLLTALENGVTSFAELRQMPSIAAIGNSRLQQALMVLVGAGYVQPALPDDGMEERARRCRAFNHAIARRARWSADLVFLASPVFGGGVALDQVALLILLGRLEGEADIVKFTWDALSRNGQRLMKDGQALMEEGENLSELATKVDFFQSHTVPLLCRLGIL